MSPAPVKPETSDLRPQLRLRDVAPSATVTVPESLKSGGRGKKRGGKSAAGGNARRQRSAPARKGSASLHEIRFRRYGAWALFLLLGGVSWAMRYKGWLGVEQEISEFGPWVILFLHVLVTILAAREDLFTGALCLLIPGYSLFYLLAHSGRAWLCAITCGLLIGLGQDSWIALHAFAIDFYDGVNERIVGGR